MNSVHAPVDWSNRASLPPFHSATQMLSNGSMHAPYGVAALVGIRCVATLRVAGSYMLIAPVNIQCTQILPWESTRPPISGPFRVARITRARTFDQVVEAQLQKTGRGGFNLDVLADPQHENGSAFIGGTLCLTDVTTSRRTGTVRVDVPDECLPQGAGVLRVTTYTQEKNGSGPGFSEVTMRVEGRVALG